MNDSREVIFGNKRVLDSYSISLPSSEPLQVTYSPGTGKELKLIFNFNILEHGPAEISVEPIGEAASFQVDIVRGKRGRMPEMKAVAESKDAILYVYAVYEATQKDAITFTYTLFEEKIEDAEEHEDAPAKSRLKKK
jgi:hypothetical protein